MRIKCFIFGHGKPNVVNVGNGLTRTFCKDCGDQLSEVDKTVVDKGKPMAFIPTNISKASTSTAEEKRLTKCKERVLEKVLYKNTNYVFKGFITKDRPPCRYEVSTVDHKGLESLLTEKTTQQVGDTEHMLAYQKIISGDIIKAIIIKGIGLNVDALPRMELIVEKESE